MHDVVYHVYEQNPASYTDAIKSLRCDRWVYAISAILTRSIVKRRPGYNSSGPENARLITASGCSRQYSPKPTTFISQNARLVAFGNKHVLGVDYLMTFAKVMEMSAVIAILDENNYPRTHFLLSAQPSYRYP